MGREQLLNTSQMARDVKEIMPIVAETTQSLGERGSKVRPPVRRVRGTTGGHRHPNDLNKVRQSL